MHLFVSFVQTGAVLDHIKPIMAKLRFWRPFCLHRYNLRFAFMDPSSRPHDDPLLVSIYVVRMRLFGQFVQMGAVKTPIKPKRAIFGHFLGIFMPKMVLFQYFSFFSRGTVKTMLMLQNVLFKVRIAILTSEH